MPEALQTFFNWFSGGERQYHSLWHCMRGDTFWVVVSVVLDLAIATGYVIIATHWSRNARFLPDSPGKRALAQIRGIFIYCGICGYLFMPIKLFWPAWRLYDIFLLVLTVYTWKYIVSSSNLRVVYNELGRTTQLRKELEASQADVAKRSAFLNAISHDLRTPLNGLSLRTELLEMQASHGDTEAMKATVADIRASTRSVAALLDQLLDYARIDRGDSTLVVTRFGLEGFVAEILRDHEPHAAEKGLSMRATIPAGLEVTTDAGRLRRILSNLVGNAIKYTPTAGGEGGGADVVVAAEFNENNLEIHVVDHGIGIPAEKQAAVFEEFVQVGNDARDGSRGFGLGLPIARGLVHQLGGEIRLTSGEGRGSRFTVVLPNVVNPDVDSIPRPVRVAGGLEVELNRGDAVSSSSAAS